MTISATTSDYNTIDQLILMGYKRAGLIPVDFAIGGDVQWNAKAEHGRQTLNRLVNGLATLGFIDHFVDFFVLDLVAGQPNYDIDPDDNILNFVDSGSHIPANNGTEEIETTGETPVKPISRHRWNSLSSKVAESTPTLYYLHRNGPNLTLYLWPTPAATTKIRFQIHRIPGSNSTGSNTPDLQRHWDSWITYALAYEFMSDAKLPMEERITCRDDRDAELAKLKSYETSNEAPDTIFVHSTPWSSYNRY
jgi:hypothetical protein